MGPEVTEEEIPVAEAGVEEPVAEVAEEAAEEPQVVEEPVAELEAEAPAEVLPAFDDEPEEEAEPAPAFVEPAVFEPEEDDEEVGEVAAETPVVAPRVTRDFSPTYEPDLDDELGGKKDKKGKNRRRELVYDEDAGKVVARRKRKGSRRRPSYMDEFEE